MAARNKNGREPALTCKAGCEGLEPMLSGASAPSEFLRGVVEHSTTPAQRRAAVPAVLKSLRDPDPEVRAEAARTLAALKCRHRSQPEALYEAAFDPDVRVREAAMDAMCALEEHVLWTRAYVDTVAPHLQWDDELLGQLFWSSSLGIHTRALEHDDQHIRTMAGGMLGNMRGDSPRAAADIDAALIRLSRRFGDPDAARRTATLEVLVALGSQVHVPAMLPLLEDPDAVLRRLTVAMLGTMARRAAPAIPALQALFTAGRLSDCDLPPGVPCDSCVRLVAEALARIAHPDAIPAYQEMLTHRDAAVRSHGARGLRRLGPEAAPAIPSLLAALTDTGARVRTSVIDALAACGTAGGASAVLALRDDPSPAVRAAVERFRRAIDRK